MTPLNRFRASWRIFIIWVFLEDQNYEVKSICFMLEFLLSCSVSLLIQIGRAYITAVLFYPLDIWSLPSVIVNHVPSQLLSLLITIYFDFSFAAGLVVVICKTLEFRLPICLWLSFCSPKLECCWLAFLQIKGGSKSLDIPGQIMEGLLLDIKWGKFLVH